MVSVTRERLAAWLLRCNPTLTDLASRFSTPIGGWCVADNYRSRLMQPGDAVLLWVSGRDQHFVRGIWGSGHVTAPAGWADLGLRIGLELVLRHEPMATDAELRAAGVDDLEVQRMPQGSNPSWVSFDQLDRIAALLGTEDLSVAEEFQARCPR
jgi:hypothetical protein